MNVAFYVAFKRQKTKFPSQLTCRSVPVGAITIILINGVFVRCRSVLLLFQLALLQNPRT